ncbi:hypothetical protein IKQ21_01510 [bacterium]|nr:hypothetical protein [bacterium]
MKVSQISGTNFEGVKLVNPSLEHAKYVKKVLKSNGIQVTGRSTFLTRDDFASKQNIANYVRSINEFCDYECGMVFFPQVQESWIISNRFFEQKIKKILDCHYIDSEINIGI